MSLGKTDCEKPKSDLITQSVNLGQRSTSDEVFQSCGAPSSAHPSSRDHLSAKHVGPGHHARPLEAPWAISLAKLKSADSP